jgi:glycosyltransferase involved in cell wall biosynthesis
MKVLVMTAIYPTPERPAFGTFVRTQVESLRQAGVDIELFLLNGRSRKWNYPKAAFQLRRRLASGSIDLIHAHIAYVGMVARTQWEVPLVVTYWGSDLLGLINGQGKKALLSPLVVGAGRMLARWVDAAIVQSAEMARLLNNKSNVFIIPCEIDFELFRLTDRDQAKAELGLHPDKKYLLFAADPQIAVKRFPLAKAVSDELKKQDQSIELLVVCKEPQGRLALFMNACDALVFPSYQEGSPNIVKQAMACNLPIVATDVGDVREVIGNADGCYVCKAEVEDFVRRLSEILTFRRRTQGRTQIQHLAGPAIAQRNIGVYEQVLRKREAHLQGRTQTDTFIAGE